MKFKGVSPIVSFVIIVLIVITGTTLVWIYGLPVIKNYQDTTIISSAVNNLKEIDKAIKELSYQGPGSTRKLTLSIPGGKYIVDPDTNSIIFEYDTSAPIVQPGSYIKQDGLYVTSGTDVSAYNETIGSDTYWVLENDHLKAVFRNQSGNINTSEIIYYIQQKDEDKIVYINDSSVVIDNNESSSYGTGYSELSQKGQHLTKASVIYHVNSSYIDYDLYFTLRANADFLIIEVKNYVYD